MGMKAELKLLIVFVKADESSPAGPLAAIQGVDERILEKLTLLQELAQFPSKFN